MNTEATPPREDAVLTIGHSSHALDAFVTLLRQHGVTALADVRSAPYSRFNPQFNRKSLDAALKARGIAYMFLGHALGGRPDDPSCYENGRVRYDRLARTALFREGLERVVQSATSERIALMCAEKEPLVCHRTILVGRSLVEQGVAMSHILADGTLESHDKTMDRLLDSMKLPRGDLLQSRQELIGEALALKAKQIAYKDATEQDSPVQRNSVRLLTIGFTKKTAESFFGLLRESGAKRVVDVRINNVSQLAGFAKKNDLTWFLREICDMEYTHCPELAPTKELLDDYRKRRCDWNIYEARFLDLMRQRRIEETIPREVISDGCLLCSEDKPHLCHRRLVAEYLKRHWGDVEIVHLV